VHLAHVNVSRLRHPLDAPPSREFAAAVDRVNALADRSPGFVWRHRVDGRPGDPLTVVNISLWRSYRHLHDYVYRSAHGHFVRRRDEWFRRIRTPATALWWVPEGHEPTVDEALARLAHLRRYGPTPQAFTVRTRFDADGHREAAR
jgi:hypothetical protein